MKVIINKTCATVSGAEILTSGMVGKTIDVEFSAEWSDLIKIAVFTNGAVTHDVIEPTGTITIPWEVLAIPNKRVSVGFYGYTIEDGEKVLAIPTIWAELGAVRAGADPSGDPSAELSPTVAEQLQSDVNDLDERVTEIEEHGGGGGTTDHTQLINRDAANQHPMSAVTGLEAALLSKYQKPALGIPKSDLEDTVRISLGKADSALQPSALNPYRTASAQDEIDNGKASAADVTAIEAKIPNAATSANQLADKAFVNSTVGTNTAIFRGTYNSVAELEAYSGEKTNNDYAFVITTDSVGNTVYNRYKYNGSAWVFEYALNNSSFTAVQWAAIQSGITAEYVALIGTAVQPDDLMDYALKTDLQELQKKATRATVTLAAASWNNKTQTVTVQGISADETAQLIQPVPASASMAAYYDAGVLATGQAVNSLTFSCEEVPTADLTVYVVITEVSA